MKIKVVLGILALFFICSASQAQTGWQQKVKGELPLLGHRNWIVIVDSAYPLQASPGIETIETDADQLAVLDFVLGAIKDSRHVRPLVHTDKEIEYVQESEAPGVGRYREELKRRIAGIPTDSVLHQELIDRLSETGNGMHVLVLKTRMAIPYTSVFLQLDCKYWSAESEARMRKAMSEAEQKNKKKP